jgi:integrase/recombinase XerD
MLATTTPPTALTTSHQPEQRVSLEQLLALAKSVIDSVRSENSKRAYERSLKSFFQWYMDKGQPALCKPIIQAYVDELRGQGLGAVTINQRLTTVRNLVKEAIDNGLLDAHQAGGILRVKGEKKEGKRLGNWLSKDQAQKLINAPDAATLKGLRDRALLAVLIGCGLRRAEAARLTFGHIQQREGRWVIVDLVGKREKTRSVPMPAFAKGAVDAWAAAAGLDLPITNRGEIFRPVNKGGRMAGENMTAQSVFETVKHYAEAQGLKIAPHDLRRTFAKLARKGGADLKQIQLTLGHASIKTTEIYLGEEQNLTDAPCDKLGLSLGAD